MDFEEYSQRSRQIADLVEQEDYAKALDLLRSLLASDISDRDKAMMCLNMAVVYDKMGLGSESLRYYDDGIRYELPHRQYFVAESKAAYLAEQGQVAESIALYEELLAQPALDEVSKERMRQNVQALRKRG